MRLPSGDQSGETSSAPGTIASFLCSLPSAFMIQRPGLEVVRTKAILRPSGETAGHSSSNRQSVRFFAPLPSARTATICE